MASPKTAPQPLIATITLQGVEPPVWRKFAVPSDLRILQLHYVIQNVMPWNDCHMYEFEINGRRYGTIGPDMGPGVLCERRARLGKVLGGESGTIRYLYDFGDSWKHVIEFSPSESPIALPDMPTCLDGQRACPPDDCGGIGGYEELLALRADPERDDPEDLRGWLGPEFDPESFDLDAANARLAEPPRRSQLPLR